MPEVVSCPNCQRRARLPDKLLGKRVRCPGCKEIFTATLNAPPPTKKEEPKKKKDDEGDGYEIVEDAPKKRRRTDDDEDDERGADKPRVSRRADDDEDDEDRSRRPRRSRAADDDEDDEDRSRRSREDDEEEAPRRRPPQWKKKRRRKKSLSLGGLDSSVKAVLGVVGVCLLLSLVGIFVPVVAFVPVGVGWLMSVVGGLWFLVVAFQDDGLQGLLCLCLPFYWLYYLITHFEETKGPFFLYLIGFGVMMMGYCGGIAGGALKGDAGMPNRPRAELQAPACRLA